MHTYSNNNNNHYSDNRNSHRKNNNNDNNNDSNDKTFVSYGQGCSYDRRRKLVSVRRLRIINMMIECSADVPHLIECTQPNVLAHLIARQAIKEEDEIGPGQGRGQGRGGGKIKERDVEKDREQVVLNWAVSALRSSVNVMDQFGRQREKENNWNYDAMGNANVNKAIAKLEVAAEQPVMQRLMKLLCGATDIMRRMRIDDIHGNRGPTVAIDDEETQV